MIKKFYLSLVMTSSGNLVRIDLPEAHQDFLVVLSEVFGTKFKKFEDPILNQYISKEYFYFHQFFYEKNKIF